MSQLEDLVNSAVAGWQDAGGASAAWVGGWPFTCSTSATGRLA